MRFELAHEPAVLRACAAGEAQEAKVADDRLFLYCPYHRWRDIPRLFVRIAMEKRDDRTRERNPAKDAHDRMLVCDNELVLSLPPPFPRLSGVVVSSA